MELGFYPKVHRALRRAGSLLESYSSSEPKWISSAGIAADWRLQSLLSAAVGVQPLPVCACFKLRLYQCVCLSSRVSFASLALSALLFLKRETLAEKKMEKRQITLLARAKMAMMLDRTCVLSSYTDERRWPLLCSTRARTVCWRHNTARTRKQTSICNIRFREICVHTRCVPHNNDNALEFLLLYITAIQSSSLKTCGFETTWGSSIFL